MEHNAKAVVLVEKCPFSKLNSRQEDEASIAK
jgi:hypothetical protein